MASFSAPTRADARTRTGDPFITSELGPLAGSAVGVVSGLRAGKVPIVGDLECLAECTRRRQLEKHRVVLVEPQLADEPAAVPHGPSVEIPHSGGSRRGQAGLPRGDRGGPAQS